ncbi:dTDP-4-dehydrorhamnose 3,5-epimerase [Pacificibacter maritimus]|uniref:dTDP-4-dehydrorhamnose 3,5-epimerase n=1 Tax=Pacificibacter maritimus TaxID=762213 RepID=A0A3N4TWW7_9RHOB|nr:dTDP-4-dehydrorhamnose 3,5-epimerase [Pacificibacter maritimus]RPE62962.1 dTDP-4-dehydrorhamnose 3,5-epimerase [Pacificibacter maritimus]
MKIEQTTLPGVFEITPPRVMDHRGFFSESWNKSKLESHGLILPEFVQDNHSMSRDIGTVRGMHFQAPPHAQGKLIRCGRGAIFDVAVDIRKGSPTFGQWIGRELSFENGLQLWVPSGFLHGFMTLQSDSEVIYKCTDYYAPQCDGVVKWDSCGIDWPIGNIPPVLSEKDEIAQSLADFDTPFTYGTTPELSDGY